MMSETKPRVIACLPSYNAEKFIERTLWSLRNQTYSNYRVLISDDCSTDRTVEFIEEFIKNDDRFLLIKQKKNLGWVGNMNFILSEAVRMGDFVFISTHDDVPDPKYIESMMKAFRENPDAVIAYGDIKWIKVGGKTEIVSYPEGHAISDKMKRLKTVLSKKYDYWVFYRGIIPAETVKKILPLEMNIFGHKQYHSDWLWLVKIAHQGEMIRVPGVSYTKHNQPASYSGTWAYNVKNYFGVLATCSLIIWRFPLKITDRISLQLPVLDLAARYIARKSGIYFLVQKVRGK